MLAVVRKAPSSFNCSLCCGVENGSSTKLFSGSGLTGRSASKSHRNFYPRDSILFSTSSVIQNGRSLISIYIGWKSMRSLRSGRLRRGWRSMASDLTGLKEEDSESLLSAISRCEGYISRNFALNYSVRLQVEDSCAAALIFSSQCSLLSLIHTFNGFNLKYHPPDLVLSSQKYALNLLNCSFTFPFRCTCCISLIYHLYMAIYVSSLLYFLHLFFTSFSNISLTHFTGRRDPPYRSSHCPPHRLHSA
jgi:hypothetical protein